MTEIKSKQNELIQLRDEANNIEESARQENREIKKNEFKRLNEILDEIDQLENEIKTLERKDRRFHELEQPTELPVTHNEPIRHESGITRAFRPGEKTSYRSLMGIDENQTLSNGGFDSFYDFMQAVTRGYDPKLEKMVLEGTQKRADMKESIPSSGGFAVPDAFGEMLLDPIMENSLIFNRAQVRQMKSNVQKFPCWAIGSHSSNLYDGVIAYFKAEASSLTETEPKVREITLTARKLSIFSQVSNEMLQDAPNFDRNVTQVLSDSIMWYADYYAIQGVGGNEPLGLLSSPNKIQISGETGQVTDTLCYENIIKMYARMLPKCIGQAVFLSHPSCLPSLLELVIPIGTGGTHVPLVKEGKNGGMQILNRPLLLSEKMPAIGDADCLVFADLSQFMIGIRGQLQIAKSQHVGFQNDLETYRLILRYDCQSIQNESLTPKKGSDTLSSIVGIAAI